MTPRMFSLLVERYREGMKRADRRAGTVAAMIYNANRDSEKDPKGADWDDFFSEWKAKPEEQTEEEMFELMQMFASKSNEGVS